MRRLSDENSGFILPTLVAFMAIIGILSAVVLQVSVSSQNVSIRQQYIQQAQLSAAAAMDFAKEQYELDITYMGTAETDLSTAGRVRTTYEIEHIEFTNAVNTQQKVRAIGRVYEDGEAIAQREIIGNLTRIAGSGASSRFIFIIDNSGSMDVDEWNDSKTTVDIAIEYVIDNVNNAEVAVVQYGTNNWTSEHKYDVTVPFTTDKATATGWDRRYGPGTTATDDYQDYLAASIARMRAENVYGPGGELDLVGATSVQYVIFTDAWGVDYSGCCSALKHIASTTIDTTNGGTITTELEHGEFNALKDGTVYTEHGYTDVTAQFTILSINQSTSRETIETPAGIASPGGSWTGVVDENPTDPEGEGIIPRRYISTSLLATDPNDILDIIDEIIEAELNF